MNRNIGLGARGSICQMYPNGCLRKHEEFTLVPLLVAF